MRSWVLPNINDTIEEVNHLIRDADDDGDKRLNITEIRDHYEHFVGSAATNHGKVLHQELWQKEPNDSRRLPLLKKRIKFNKLRHELGVALVFVCKNIFTCIYSVYNISLSHHEQVYLMGLRFKRYLEKCTFIKNNCSWHEKLITLVF